MDRLSLSTISDITTIMALDADAGKRPISDAVQKYALEAGLFDSFCEKYRAAIEYSTPLPEYWLH